MSRVFQQFKLAMRSLVGSRMVKGSLPLMRGTALAQAVGVAASPILSRLYTPEDFGVLGTVLSVVAIASVSLSLKYEMAIVLEKSDRAAAIAKRLSLYILSGTATILGLALLSTPFWIVDLLPADSGYVHYLPWCAPLLLATGLFNIYKQCLNRDREYRALARAAVFQRLLTVVTQIVLGFCGAQVLGLLVGNTLGLALGLALVVCTSKRGDTSDRVSRASLREFGGRHYRFPAYMAPQGLLNTLSQNLPVYLLGLFYGMEVVGAYWFARQILQLPVGLVGESVRQVFFKEAAESMEDVAALRKLFLRTTLALVAVVFVPATCVVVWGPEIFVFAFGDQWLMAGEYSTLMVLWVGMGVINPPATTLFVVLGLQKYGLVIDAALLVSRAGVLIYAGLSQLSSLHAIGLYAVVGVIFNLGIILFMGFQLRKRK